MTKKQLLVLILLLASALVPILGGSGKKVKPNHFNAGESNPRERNEARTGLTSDPELFAKADQTLTKLTSLKELGTVPGPKIKSSDELLKETQFILPAEDTQVPAPTNPPEIVAKLEPTPKTTPTSTPIPTVVPTDIPPEESPVLPEATKTPESVSRESAIENEKLQLKIISLEAKLDEQKRNLESKVSDLKSKLDIQESENVKLSHQIQNAENNSADAAKLQAKIKDMELRLTKAKSELLEERKRSEEGKSIGLEYSKRLSEEQKLRKSIEDQLEAAVRKRDDQAKDNEKLRRVVGDFEKRVRLIEEQRLALSEDKEQVLLKQLGGLRKELTSTQAALDELKKRQKSQSAEVSAAGSKLDAMKDQLAEKQKQNDDLSIKLATAERLNERSKGLQQELLAARNELMLAQEQVRTLISTSKNPSEYQNRNFQRPEIIQPTRTERPIATAQPTTVPAASDYLTVEVTTQKAALRAGPGEENSIVMEIQQGSRLMVETKQGDWFRVVTPKGQRAYIRSDLVVELDSNGRQRYPVGAGRTPRPTRTLNPNPPDSDPLVELLGRQLKERKKAQQPDDSLKADGPTQAPTPSPSEGNIEEEMEAFENLKKGMKKEGASD